MSFNLSINGHHADPAEAEAIDEIVRAGGAQIVESLAKAGFGRAQGLYATFTGPTGSFDLVPLADSDDDGTPTEPDGEGTSEPDVPAPEAEAGEPTTTG